MRRGQGLLLESWGCDMEYPHCYKQCVNYKTKKCDMCTSIVEHHGSVYSCTYFEQKSKAQLMEDLIAEENKR